MHETSRPERERTRVLLFVLLGVAAVLTVVLVLAFSLFLHFRKQARGTVGAEPVASETVQTLAEARDFSSTNSVSIDLGGNEAEHGLMLVHEKDGRTEVESIEGATARVGRLANNRSELYFYFRIDPTFKQQDVRSVRIDVEYLALQRGSVSVHYDSEDAPNRSNPAYRSTGSLSLAGTNAWKKGVFRTKNDAAFINRQNGGADFRICAKTPELYVRRVTVTRDTGGEQPWSISFFTASNQVSVALGRETPEDGVRHLDSVGDGQTVVTNVDGVACRYLNRLGSRSPWGSLYFQIHPRFKGIGPMNARVEVEYLTTQNNAFRVQFDGEQNGRRSSYVSALPVGRYAFRYLNRNAYAVSATNDVWSVATFQITNALFMNSQNGEADFRFEVVPPEIYVRRVTVTREGTSPALP